MRPWLVVMFCTVLGCGPAQAACAGTPYDQFDFWLGTWHDPAAPAAEQYAVRPGFAATEHTPWKSMV